MFLLSLTSLCCSLQLWSSKYTKCEQSIIIINLLLYKVAYYFLIIEEKWGDDQKQAAACDGGR